MKEALCLLQYFYSFFYFTVGVRVCRGRVRVRGMYKLYMYNYFGLPSAYLILLKLLIAGCDVCR